VAAKKAKTQTSPTIGAHALIKESFRFIAEHKRTLLKVVLVGVTINSLFQVFLTPEAVTLYQGMWFIFFSAALIWTIRHSGDKKVAVNASSAFYEGTAPTLRLLLVVMVLAIAGTPFTIGAFVLASVNSLLAKSSVAIALAGFIWILLTYLTFWLWLRMIFSPIIVTLPQVRPMQAMQISWSMGKHRMKFIITRLLVFLFYALIALIALVALISVLPLPGTIQGILMILVGNGLILPVVYVYLFNLYLQLQ